MSMTPMAAEPDADGDRPGLSNVMHLATRVFRSDLYWRNPRFTVKQPALNRVIFTPTLARIEAGLLNDWADETNLYLHMRRAILDGALGPYGVLKMTYNEEIDADVD